MSEFENINESSELNCTYAISKDKLVYQAIYICETCQNNNMMSTNSCCCLNCSKICHKDHEISLLTYGLAYCDCGSSICNPNGPLTCQLITNSIRKYSHINFNSVDNNNNEQIKSFTITNLNNPDLLSLLISQCIELTNHTKETYWIGYIDKPKTYLEDYAKNILLHHLSLNQIQSFDINTTGAEYWIQVKDSNNSIDLHYDKDENIANLFGLGVFPFISTITYLTSNSNNIPTLIVDNVLSKTIGEPIKKCYISTPKIGKHIAFDGRLLHGAPKQLINNNNCNNDIRITLLVNIWVNYKPLGLINLPDHLLYISQLPASFANYPYNIVPINGSNNIIKVNKSTINQCNWIDVPFISEESSWGKDDDETGIYLHILIPNSINYNESNIDYYTMLYNHKDAYATLEYEFDEDELIEEMNDITS